MTKFCFLFPFYKLDNLFTKENPVKKISYASYEFNSKSSMGFFPFAPGIFPRDDFKRSELPLLGEFK